MNILLRFLGFEMLAALGRRLPPQGARAFSLATLVFANLLPVVLVVFGQWRVGDIFLLYWIENVALWLTTIVRVASVRSPTSHRAAGIGAAFFFAVHYGIFTLVHGAFTMVIVGVSGGLESTPFEMLVATLLIFSSQLVPLVMNWFGRAERVGADVQRTMMAPYPRMVVLHVSIILGFFAVLSLGSVSGEGTGGVDDGSLLAALLLCALKTLVDLGLFAVRDLRHSRQASGVTG